MKILMCSCWLPCEIQMLVSWNHDITQGIICYVMRTTKNNERDTRFRITKTELKCQPILLQINFLTLSNQAVSSKLWYYKLTHKNEYSEYSFHMRRTTFWVLPLILSSPAYLKTPGVLVYFMFHSPHTI